MKVILNQDVKGLGKRLEKVEVNEGYARNFLLPRKIASIADSRTEAEASSKKQAIQFKKDTEREKAIELKEKIEKTVVEFRLKLGDGNKLFGSVTSKEIKDRLFEVLHVDIDKKKIELETQVKTPGMYNADVKLYEGVIAKLKVRVLGI